MELVNFSNWSMGCNRGTPSVPKAARGRDVQEVQLTPLLKRKRSDNSYSSGKARKRGDFDDSSNDGQYDIPNPGVIKVHNHNLCLPFSSLTRAQLHITFFGENLPDRFYTLLNSVDGEAVDLVIVMGTSMKAAAVSQLPHHISHSVPHIYISHNPCTDIEFDINLLGDCDVVAELCRRGDWPLRHEIVRPGEAAVESAGDFAWRVRPPVAEAEASDGVAESAVGEQGTV